MEASIFSAKQPLSIFFITSRSVNLLFSPPVLILISLASALLNRISLTLEYKILHDTIIPHLHCSKDSVLAAIIQFFEKTMTNCK